MRKIDPFHYGRIEKDEVNQQAVQNYFQLIDEAEAFYNAQIRQVVEQMGGGQDRATVICLSGPSASGKTTTAHTLARHFISSGRKAMVISLDDFYMDTEQTPLNRKGKPDFESIYALDIERINRCIKELIEQGRTNIPIFDFHVRKRLEGMEREIAFRLTPMPELLERAAAESPPPVCTLFARCRTLLDELGERSMAELWREALEQVPLGLDGPGRLALEELGEVLGRYDGDGQREALAHTRAELSRALEQAREAREKQGRMYQVLGITAGAFLVILLL